MFHLKSELLSACLQARRLGAEVRLVFAVSVLFLLKDDVERKSNTAAALERI